MRINSDPLKSQICETARCLEESGEVPAPPSVLGARSFVELVEKNRISINVDEKYPQAMGINIMPRLMSNFGNSIWEVLYNNNPSDSVFTSDYPLTLEPTDHPMIQRTVIPLTPRMALRVIPIKPDDDNDIDLEFSKFRFRSVQLRRKEVVDINRNVVRCAGELVFSSKLKNWMPDFVMKNRRYRIEMVTSRLPSTEGAMFIYTKTVKKR